MVLVVTGNCCQNVLSVVSILDIEVKTSLLKKFVPIVSRKLAF